MAIQLFEGFRRFLSLFSQKEVKTPLSFFFRIMFYLSVVAVAMIVWGKPELQKMVFASFALLILFGFVVVAVFAWCKPRNLR